MDNSQNSDNGYNNGGQSDNNNSGNYNQGANNDYNNSGQFNNGYGNQNPNGNGYNNGQFNNGYNHNNGYNSNNFNNGYNNGNQFNNGYNNFNRQPYYQKPKDKLGIFSLIFGIASVLTSMLYFVGIPLAITAIVLAILSRSRIGRFQGTAVAGLCIGICGVCLGLLFFAVMLAMFSNPDFINALQQLYDTTNIYQ